MIFEELQMTLDEIILDMLEDDEIEIRNMPFVSKEESIKMKKELWHRFKKSKEYKDLWEDDRMIAATLRVAFILTATAFSFYALNMFEDPKITKEGKKHMKYVKKMNKLEERGKNVKHSK